jgi:hypothetical protein
MKTTLTILSLLLTTLMFAQNEVQYSYDQAGNREERFPCQICKVTAPPETTDAIHTLNAGILPNPTKVEMVIKVTEEGILAGEEESDFQVIVYDIYGREVVNERHTSVTFNIDISDKPPGAYFVKLTSADKIKRWEIIKN